MIAFLCGGQGSELPCIGADLAGAGFPAYTTETMGDLDRAIRELA